MEDNSNNRKVKSHQNGGQSQIAAKTGKSLRSIGGQQSTSMVMVIGQRPRLVAVKTFGDHASSDCHREFVASSGKLETSDTQLTETR